MLTRLYVKNYALIRELELDFDTGLTIITGETGAGKSIILGALSLILGKRADNSTLLDKKHKCIVEGTFSTGDSLKSTLKENDIDVDANTIFRREVVPGGRSRSFINDTPVTLDTMKEIGSRLIDIHSQHQTIMLGDNSFQLAVIDSFSDHNALLEDYSEVYNRYKRLYSEYEYLEKNSERNLADLDYYNHQLEQIESARLRENEEVELKENQKLLTHAGEIHDVLERSAQILSNDEMSVLGNLKEVKRLLSQVENFFPDSVELNKRIESAMIELNDIANEAYSRSGSIESDPGKLDEINQRLDLIYSLMQKHHVNTTGELIKQGEDLKQKVSELETSDYRLEEIRKNLDRDTELLTGLATEISNTRREAVEDVEKKMSELLGQLGMPNGRFEVNLTSRGEFTPRGTDHVEFLFSANKQVIPESLSKVASGGELSRVMLSLKSLFSDNRELPTIFFDEIDAGVSGEVASKVGEILASMGQKMQVINITHLPQVAAKARLHYYVYKEDEKHSTITRIKLLDKKERLNEVARLLSGNEITPASIANARQLIREGNQE